jgi:hypothetical protein
MSKGLFQSPKKALLFVGMTLFSVAMLVGTEDEEGALVQAAASVESSTNPSYPGDEFRADTLPEPRSRNLIQESEPVTWADDDELIDDTSGFDPTPEEFDPSDGDMYVLEDDY